MISKIVYVLVMTVLALAMTVICQPDNFFKKIRLKIKQNRVRFFTNDSPSVVIWTNL